MTSFFKENFSITTYAPYRMGYVVTINDWEGLAPLYATFLANKYHFMNRFTNRMF